jgi:hypothetical protein
MQTETPLGLLNDLLSNEPREVVENVFTDWIEIDLELKNLKQNCFDGQDQLSKEINLMQDEFENGIDKVLDFCSLKLED